MNTVTRARQDLLRRARENLAAGRLSAARADFEEALAMGPAEPVDYNDYGRVLNNLREFDQARQALASAVALDPGFAEAHNNLGHVLRSLNKAADPEADAGLALQHLQFNALIAHAMLQVLVLASQFAPARPPVRQCLEAGAEDGGLRRGHGPIDGVVSQRRQGQPVQLSRRSHEAPPQQRPAQCPDGRVPCWARSSAAWMRAPGRQCGAWPSIESFLQTQLE